MTPITISSVTDLVVKLDDISTLFLPSLPTRPHPTPLPRPAFPTGRLQKDVLDNAQARRADATSEPPPRTRELFVLLDDALERDLRSDAVDLAHAIRAAGGCGGGDAEEMKGEDETGIDGWLMVD